MYLLKEFYGELSDSRIAITQNKNPIKMEKFLNFLTVPVVRSSSHLGSCNGWTKLDNGELKLSISGGIVSNVEYLDSIQFGKKLGNQFNNYVNPFYLHDILTGEGLDFFYIYYIDEISKQVNNLSEKIVAAKKELNKLTEFYDKITNSQIKKLLLI